MIETQILGAAVGIQRQDVIDKSETTVLPSLANGVMAGHFKRGRMDKPFKVTAKNYKALLGHDPSNPSYLAVEDAFKRGVSEISILRVGQVGSDVGVGGGDVGGGDVGGGDVGGGDVGGGDVGGGDVGGGDVGGCSISSFTIDAGIINDGQTNYLFSYQINDKPIVKVIFEGGNFLPTSLAQFLIWQMPDQKIFKIDTERYPDASPKPFWLNNYIADGGFVFEGLDGTELKSEFLLFPQVNTLKFLLTPDAPAGADMIKILFGGAVEIKSCFSAMEHP